jgi:hypothetical protein
MICQDDRHCGRILDPDALSEEVYYNVKSG